jgi:hypothetical protein
MTVIALENIGKQMMGCLVSIGVADYENFYPKEKKEIPKGNDQKSESKGSISIFLAGRMLIFARFTIELHMLTSEITIFFINI